MAKLSPALVALIASCVMQGQDVKTRYMPGTDFSKYRTYSWVTIPGAAYPDQIIDTDIKRSIDSQLVAKGLTRVDSNTLNSTRTAGFAQPSNLPEAAGLPQPPPGLPLLPQGLSQQPGPSQPPSLRPTADSAPTADLLIAYHVAINRETQWNAFGSSFDRFPGGGGWGMGSGTLTSSTIEVGTLVLQMYDPVAKQLVWSGSATKTINISKKQEKNQQNMQKAMAKLLKDYPPGQK